MVHQLDLAWRLFATGFSFSIFGIGGFFLGFAIFPFIHLLSQNRVLANNRSQYLVHLSLRLFIWVLRELGVLTYEMEGKEKLKQSKAKLIISAMSLSLLKFVGQASLVDDAMLPS